MQAFISNFLRVFRPETSHAPHLPGHIEVATGVDAEVVSAETRRWILLAVGSIVIAGLLSSAVVVGRLPFISQFIDDPLWFKRCLVVHVDLALVVWFYAFIAGLISLVKSGSGSAIRKGAFIVSVVGVVGMLMGGVAKGAQPVLANYIPVIDHPFFLGGLGLFFLGVVVQFVHALISANRVSTGIALPASVPGETAVGLQASAIVVVLAGATWIATRAGMPGNLDIQTHFEFSVWGAGHVLQVANVAAMLAVWMWLMKRATGESMFTARQANMVFGALIVPHFIMPILTLRGPLDTLYHSGATFLMRWCIFPVTLFVLVRGFQHLWRHRGRVSDWTQKMAKAGFYASAGLTLFGFILGACIRSSTTLVPAHYHASLGGITAAFMAAAYLILAAIAERKPGTSLDDRFWRSCKRQLAVFGVGQLVFVLGFAIGGVYGLGRKTYASEQTARSLGELTGLTVMGVGGLFASDLTMLFLFIHAGRTFVARKFTGSRWLPWVSGIIMCALIWFIGWTGYWLIWDQPAQQIAMSTMQLVDLLPIFGEPMSRLFVVDRLVPSLLFFVVFFTHMLLPLGIAVGLAIHLMRVTRARLLPNRIVSFSIIGGIALAAFVIPAPLDQEAHMNEKVDSFTVDAWYMSPLAFGLRASFSANGIVVRSIWRSGFKCGCSMDTWKAPFAGELSGCSDAIEMSFVQSVFGRLPV